MWKRYWPSNAVGLITTVFILLIALSKFMIIRENGTMEFGLVSSLNLLFCILWLPVVLWGVSFLFFPRIVVTVKNGQQNHRLSIFCDGRDMEFTIPKDTEVHQFAFQVWKETVYDIYLPGGKDSPKRVNLYEQKPCHVLFELATR